MIVAEGLTKRFGSFTAIRDVSFQVEPGEIVGFLGPNGAGKSTTMRILSGVFPPTEGRATIAGHDVVADPLRARQAVGYFPERIALYGEMTVREYLGWVAEMKGVERRRRATAIGSALDQTAIASMAHRRIGTLSKGYRQRVGIAQALLGDPAVLILDEPTSGLDPEQVAEVRQLISSLRQRATVLLSSHVLPEIEATCDRVVILHRGRIRAVDAPANLARQLRILSRVRLELLAPPDEAQARLRQVKGVLSVQPLATTDGTLALEITTEPGTDARGDLARTVTEAGWTLLELRPLLLSLEEVFLAMVQEPSDKGVE